MAIIGHWLAAFPVCYFVPQASATFLLKLSMLSDALFGLFVLLKIENMTVFAWYQKAAYPATVSTIEHWKQSRQWLTSGIVADQGPGDAGFEGYSVLWPVYLNAPYSHSVEFMAIIAVVIGVYMRVWRHTSLSYTLGIVLVVVSHPIMDMFFHDATWRMGNRAETRCCLHFWQTPWLGPFAFALEVAMAYFGYKLWMSSRVPIKEDTATITGISHYSKMFWKLAITNNMLSFYVLAPFSVWAFSTWLPQVQAYTPYAYWSMALVAFTLWSWTTTLYPIYKLEQLTQNSIVMSDAREDWYIKVPV